MTTGPQSRQHTMKWCLNSFILLLLSAALQAQQPDGLAVLSTVDSNSIKLLLAKADSLKLGYPASAEPLYQEALVQSEKKNYTSGLLHSLTELAILSARSEQYEQSLRAIRRALAHCNTSMGHQKIKATLYNCMGNVFDHQGRFEKAFLAYNRAIHYAAGDSERLAAIYTNMAIVLKVLLQPQKALQYINNALAICPESLNPETHVGLLINKGNCLKALNQLSQSTVYLDSAITKARTFKLFNKLSFALANKSYKYIEQGQAAKAVNLLHKEGGELLNSNQVQPRGKASILQALGAAHFHMRQYQHALEYYTAAQKMASPKDQLNILHQIASIYERGGLYKEALYTYRRYKQLEDSLGATGIHMRVNNMEVKYRTAQKDKKLAIQAMELATRQKVIASQNHLITLISSGILLILILSAWRYRHIRKKRQHNEEVARLKGFIDGEERERSRLAQELHDNINSQLAAIQAHLTAGIKTSLSPPFADTNITTAQTLLLSTSENVRRIAHSLSPYHLQSLGLINAIKVFYKSLFSDSLFEAEVEAYGNFEHIDPVLTLNLYRIAQELALNTKKHAHATTFLLLLSHTEYQITLTAEDNGLGFSTEKYSRNDVQGIGLDGIHARVDTYKGKVEIVSTPGNGTAIHIIIPYSSLNKKQPMQNPLVLPTDENA